MRKCVFSSVLAALLLSVAHAQTKTPAMTGLQLRIIPNGAVLEGTLTPKGKSGDVLKVVFSPRRKTIMLSCSPRCKPVTELSLAGASTFGPDASNRVILGGSFEVNKKVNLIVQFRSGVAVVEVPVVAEAQKSAE